MDDEHPRITLDPERTDGQTDHPRYPVVGRILSWGCWLTDGAEAEILANYPGITHEDVIACLGCARVEGRFEK